MGEADGMSAGEQGGVRLECPNQKVQGLILGSIMWRTHRSANHRMEAVDVDNRQ
jgi:hypothetical protein